jgi:hypothetical protein
VEAAASAVLSNCNGFGLFKISKAIEADLCLKALFLLEKFGFQETAFSLHIV